MSASEVLLATELAVEGLACATELELTEAVTIVHIAVVASSCKFPNGRKTYEVIFRVDSQTPLRHRFRHRVGELPAKTVGNNEVRTVEPSG